MHPSSSNHAADFVNKYMNPAVHLRVLDVGSFNVNGTLKQFIVKDACVCPTCCGVFTLVNGTAPICTNCKSQTQHNMVHDGSMVMQPTTVLTKGDNWTYDGLDIEEWAGPHNVLAPENSYKSVSILMKEPYTFPIEDNSYDIIISTSAFEHIPFFWKTFDEIVRVTKPGGYIYIDTPLMHGYHAYPYDCWRFEGDAYKALAMWNTGVILVESFVDRNSSWLDSIGIFQKK